MWKMLLALMGTNCIACGTIYTKKSSEKRDEFTDSIYGYQLHKAWYNIWEKLVERERGWRLCMDTNCLTHVVLYMCKKKSSGKREGSVTTIWKMLIVKIMLHYDWNTTLFKIQLSSKKECK